MEGKEKNPLHAAPLVQFAVCAILSPTVIALLEKSLMHRGLMRLLPFIVLLVGVTWLTAPVRAVDIPLPTAAWYAVAWVEATDTLHWINAQGEQTSIARPMLPGEINPAQSRLHIAPNGQYLVVIASINTGRESIGFYDLAQGIYTQTHQSESNEVFLPAGRTPFTEFSTQFVIPLRNQLSGAWRIITFDAASGSALAQLTFDDPLIPEGFQGMADLLPVVAQFNVDEGRAVNEVRFKLNGAENVDQTNSPSLKWIISAEQTSLSVELDSLGGFNTITGFDMHPLTGESLYAVFDPQPGTEPNPNTSNTIVLVGETPQILASEIGGSASLPRWLHNGEWFGYWRDDGAGTAQWVVLNRETETLLPLDSAISQIYHTPDGLLAQNRSEWRLDHLTDLASDDPAGLTLFQPGSAFIVVYHTPADTAFTLITLGEPDPEAALALVENPATQPTTCGDKLVARLAPGMTARVAAVDGTPLRLRSAPAGQMLTQLQQGTTFMVIGGPECVRDFLWWNIQLLDGTRGWAAESDTEDYYIEPFTEPAATVPTVALTATAVPTALSAATECPQSPAAQLAVNDFAHIPADLQGTLGVYDSPEASFPSADIPANTGMLIIGGPVCSPNGIRLWHMEISLNEETRFGWVAEGFGITYFLLPGLPPSGA
jgi:hypothetical protein